MNFWTPKHFLAPNDPLTFKFVYDLYESSTGMWLVFNPSGGVFYLFKLFYFIDVFHGVLLSLQIHICVSQSFTESTNTQMCFTVFYWVYKYTNVFHRVLLSLQIHKCVSQCFTESTNTQTSIRIVQNYWTELNTRRTSSVSACRNTYQAGHQWWAPPPGPPAVHEECHHGLGRSSLGAAAAAITNMHNSTLTINLTPVINMDNCIIYGGSLSWTFCCHLGRIAIILPSGRHFSMTDVFLLHSPAISLGFTILGEIFFNPTIEVVTCHLRGWCKLGVFLLPVFTCLGHECQDLLSPCDGMHVYTD